MLAGLTVVAVLAAILVAFAVVIRAVFWLLFLPFKLLKLVAVAIPLLPLACVAFVVWTFLRLMKRPATT